MNPLKRSIPFLLIFFLCFFIRPVQAQRPEFSHFFTDDGLSESFISAISQDYQGFMWFGTFNGLNRYDGYTFRVYKSQANTPGSLSSSHIETLFEDSRRRLWVGTAEGLDWYNRSADQFLHLPYSQPDSTQKLALHVISEGKDGQVWVGGWQGLGYVDMVQQTIVRFRPEFAPSANTKTVFDLCPDRQGNLWVATRQGLDFYDLSRGQFQTFHPDNRPGGLPSDEVTALLMDRKETLWVGTRKGVCIRRKGEPAFTNLLPAIRVPVNDLAEKGRTVLLATDFGLYEYDQETGLLQFHNKTSQARGLSDNSVDCLYLDDQQNLWLGTYYGLNYTGNHASFQHLGARVEGQSGLSNPFVMSLLEDQAGNLLVGTAEGVEVLDATSESLHVITDQHHALKQVRRPILSLTTDGKETIWFTAWIGEIYEYNLRTKRLQRLPNPNPLSGSLPFVRYGKDQRLWMGCGNALYTYHPPTRSYQKWETYPDQTLYYLYQDRSGCLWMGVQSGLMRYDPDEGKTTFFSQEKDPARALKVNTVHCVHEDEEGLIWIASNRGLHLLGPDGRFKNLGPSLSNDHLKSILEDERQQLWISANDGLYRLHKPSLAFRKFDSSDGLQRKEFQGNAAVKTRKGRLIFGGAGGLNSFFPENIRDNPNPPKVVITDFRILNQPVAIGSEVLPTHISLTPKLHLNYRASEFSFEFVAINFSSRKNRYAYKMEGFDEQWHYSGERRFASYTNLPAGKSYVFRVKAANEANVWNEQGASIPIYIQPPFWDTWWFRTVLYLAMGALAYTAYSFRVRSIRRHRKQLIGQKRQLQDEVAGRTAELRDANQKLREQAGQIAAMNALLRQDNQKLEHDVLHLTEARVMQKRVTFEEFQKIYPTEEACYQLIDELKNSRPFHCRKCGHARYCAGSLEYSRRCTRCNYVETITTGTLFAGIRFPITKAFYLLFLISEGKRYTVSELSELVQLRQQTCWSFKKRVEERTRNVNLQKHKDGWSHLVMLPE